MAICKSCNGRGYCYNYYVDGNCLCGACKGSGDSENPTTYPPQPGLGVIILIVIACMSMIESLFLLYLFIMSK